MGHSSARGLPTRPFPGATTWAETPAQGLDGAGSEEKNLWRLLSIRHEALPVHQLCSTGNSTASQKYTLLRINALKGLGDNGPKQRTRLGKSRSGESHGGHSG